ncbi:hypothetical protein [Chondromyces crocatus]|uniref:Uncharacterized protein n=1 Tax=Chondromyces crocatus TaxID=52 RepID=A0A0K1EB29_CHOCO|nr:hypothetical protein [Chondromyces crocatus]AKT37788.1 uncharacterized protein CMC5_019300 [Chondromyces crocatus]
MHAPFLEFSFYVGAAGERPAVEALVPNVPPGELPEKLYAPKLIGVMKGPEILAVYDRLVVLRTKGEAFCFPSCEEKVQPRRLGRIVYKRFVEIVDTISCYYGAILVEYSLETPEELQRDPRSLAFRDFFVSEEVLGSRTVQQIIALAGDDAYVEQRRRGVYISMNKELNPRHRQVAQLDQQERSMRIAMVLGKALP